MPSVSRALVCAFAMAAISAPIVSAQTLSATDTPAYISVVEGTATIDREDQSQPAVANMPLVAGDRLTTDRSRLEILYPEGSALSLDERSVVELQAPTLLRVMSGRIRLVVTGVGAPASAAHFQIDTPSASATTDGPGEYRISVQPGPAGPQTEFAVLRGAGALMTERASTPLRAGERSIASADAPPSSPQAFNSGRMDAFDQWSAASREVRRGSGASAQYLPADLRIYGGTLDGGGSWQNQAPYGNVWYPTVTEDWRPYYNGYWSTVPSYGWTWIGADAWAWPTHHYGRWGQSGSRWFWIPDNRWGAAWVSWGAAPGYVGWSPLGFDNRPVIGPRSAGSQAGWVVVPRQDFGRGRSVHQYAVPPRALPATAAFVVQAAPPVPPTRGGRPMNGAAGVDGNRNRTGPSRSGAGAQPGAVPPAPMPAPVPGAVPRGTMAPVPQGTMAPVPQGTMAPVPQGTMAPVPRGTMMTPVPPGTPPANGSAPVNPAVQRPPVRSDYPRRPPVAAPAAPAAPAQPTTAPPPAAGSVRAPATIPAPAAVPPQSAGRPAPAQPAPVAPQPPVRARSGAPVAAPAPARLPSPAASQPGPAPIPAAPPATAAPPAPAAAKPPAAAPRRADQAVSPAPAAPPAPARAATPPPTRKHRDPPPPPPQ